MKPISKWLNRIQIQQKIRILSNTSQILQKTYFGTLRPVTPPQMRYICVSGHFRQFLCVFCVFSVYFSQIYQILTPAEQKPVSKIPKSDQKITKIKIFSKHILNCPKTHFGPLNDLTSLKNVEKLDFLLYFCR